MRQEKTGQELLDQYHSCVGTPDNVSCYGFASNKHTNTDTVIFIGVIAVIAVVSVVLYKLKYGGKK